MFSFCYVKKSGEPLKKEGEMVMGFDRISKKGRGIKGEARPYTQHDSCLMYGSLHSSCGMINTLTEGQDGEMMDGQTDIRTVETTESRTRD